MTNFLAVTAIDWDKYITQADMQAVLDSFLGILPTVLPTALAIMGAFLGLNLIRRLIH